VIFLRAFYDIFTKFEQKNDSNKTRFEQKTIAAKHNSNKARFKQNMIRTNHFACAIKTGTEFSVPAHEYSIIV
jgi:hypothetical protein